MEPAPSCFRSLCELLEHRANAIALYELVAKRRYRRRIGDPARVVDELRAFKVLDRLVRPIDVLLKLFADGLSKHYLAAILGIEVAELGSTLESRIAQSWNR